MKRKLAYFGIYTGLLIYLFGMFNIARVAAQSYTQMYYTQILNSLIDSTPIGSTTASTGAFTYTRVGSNSTAPTTQGAYTMWNLSNGVGETDFVNLKGSGTGGWYFYNGFGTLIGSLTPSTFNLPGITLATPPTLCANGKKPSGIDVNGNATGCTTNWTQAASASGCTAASGTYNTCGPVTVNWPTAFADANYSPSCSAVDANAGPGSSGNESGIIYIDAINAGSVTVWVQNNRGSISFSPSSISCTATHP